MYQLKVEALEKYKLYKQLKYIDTPTATLLPQENETSNGNINYKSTISTIDMEFTKEIILSITGYCIYYYIVYFIYLK